MADIFSKLQNKLGFDLNEVIDPNAADSQGRSLLQLAIARDRRFALPLLAIGADCGHQDNNGQTALHWAAANSDDEVVRALLEKGADADAVDKYGNSPLWTACMKRGNYKVVSALLGAGAIADRKNKAGRSPADMVGEFKDETLAQLFRQK